MLQVRLATLTDLDGIMDVEKRSFGDEIDKEAMATKEVMASRIILCNKVNSGWFWVAEYDGCIVGDSILQPTNLTPQQCTSWSATTDDGNLIKTFNPEGENIFAVSLAVVKPAPFVTADLLVLPTVVRWLETRKRYFMFCSRISGFSQAHKDTGIEVDDYWQMKDGYGYPQDPTLRFLCRCVGAKPLFLQKNGFPPDKESGGHSVLCAGDNPVQALKDVIGRIYHAGMTSGQKINVRIE